MAEYILFGVLVGIFLFSTIIVCWQLVLTIFEVRSILKVVRGLTEEVQPTLYEVNEILRKTNVVLDEAGDTYQALGDNVTRAKGNAKSLQQRLAHWKVVVATGARKGLEVYQTGLAEADANGEEPLQLSSPDDAEQVSLPQKDSLSR